MMTKLNKMRLVITTLFLTAGVVFLLAGSEFLGIINLLAALMWGLILALDWRHGGSR